MEHCFPIECLSNKQLIMLNISFLNHVPFQVCVVELIRLQNDYITRIICVINYFLSTYLHIYIYLEVSKLFSALAGKATWNLHAVLKKELDL